MGRFRPPRWAAPSSSTDWDFGTGVQASGMLVSHVYPKAGAYTVVLTVTDDAGNRASTSKAVTVIVPTP